MLKNKTGKIFLILLNIAGVLCLLWFAVPYLLHDTTVAHPDAMLPAEAWDSAGMALTAGCLPLLAVNIAAFRFVKTRRKSISFLFLVPGVLCLILAGSYLVSAMR